MEMSRMSEEVEELQSQVEDLQERVTELEQRLNEGGSTDDAGDIREFVESFDPSSHTERSLAIAYYLETYRERENFTVNDIEEGYRECRVQAAGNLSDVLGRMEDNNWLLRDGKENRKQLWRLTANGLDKLEEEIEDGT